MLATVVFIVVTLVTEASSKDATIHEELQQLRQATVVFIVVTLVTEASSKDATIHEELQQLRQELIQCQNKSQDYLLKILDLVSSQSQKIESQAKEIDQMREGLNKMPYEERISKRIVYHSLEDVLGVVTSLQNDFSKLKTGLPKASGSTYVRWGRKSCPSVNGTELVYSGFAGGSYYTDSGAASNYICLAPDPDWAVHYSDAHDAGATVYGAEYQLGEKGIGTSKAEQFVGGNPLYEEDVPCSVCRSSRPTTVMIPGKNQCYKGWTMEYKGYLTAGYRTHSAASEFVCLDNRPETLRGGHTNQNGKLFYFVEGRCGSLPCPPYTDGRELTCVVCTK